MNGPTRLGLALALATTLVASRASALAIPAFGGYVTDKAGLLEPDDRARLAEKLTRYREQGGAQMALLIIPSLDGEQLDEYAVKVASAWQLGTKGKDDGLLMLVVTDDRRITIQVGYGLEGTVPDVIAGRVIRNVLGPAFRDRDYLGGIDRAFDALMTAASGNAAQLPDELTHEQRRARRTSSPALIFFFILFVIISSIGRRRRYGGWMLWGVGNALLNSGRSSGGGFFGGSGGGGGGFSGGGGGRFGGGGASGGVVMLFSDADRSAVEKAVQEAEAQTSGEIVVIDVERSATYGTERAIAAAVLAAALACAMVLIVPHFAAPIYLLAQVPFFALAWAVVSTPRLQRLLAGVGRMDAATRARAAALFSERGIHVTRDRTGVLLMLSQVEQRVVILADAGINARVPDGAWTKHVEVIVAAIHRGAAGDGVAQVVREIGVLLAKDFPRRSDDVNELPDRPQHLP